MWQMIPNDFDVKLASEVGEGRLFAARRDTIWHFVKAVPGEVPEQDENFTRWDIGQSHVPRYAVAKAVTELKGFNSYTHARFDAEKRFSTTCSAPVGIYSRGPGSYDINLFETAKGWPKWMVDLVKEDIAALDRCQADIVRQNDMFLLPDLTTPTGHPVVFGSRELIEAIAFESEILSNLDATSMGAFGAYCVWRDLICAGEISREYCEQLIDNQFQYDATEFSESPFLDLVMKVQDAIFTKPVWGLVDGDPVTMSETEATDVVVEAMSKLSGIQLTQFWLMDKLHSGGLFLPLAQVLGINSWEQYAVWKTQQFQPDSEEEQSIRSETAYIKMMGDLTEE